MVTSLLAFVAGAVVAAVATVLWFRSSSRRGAPNQVLAEHATPPWSQQAVDALDALPVGVIITTAEGEPVVRNRAAHLDRVRHHEVLLDEALDELRQLARATGGSHDRVLELHGQQSRVLVLAVHPLGQGGVIATISDISERVRLDRIRTDFVANLSHELKTPVGALSVLAETVADLVSADALDADDRQAVMRLAEKMVAESHRMSAAISELLELSRIELEGLPTRVDADVMSLVCGAVERVRPLAEPAGIRVAMQPLEHPVTVCGDPRQLTSALGNLLENAVKYSEPGSEVDIVVTSRNDAVEFAVRDRGMGIPARDLDRVFERFYRVDRARSRDTGGTGLGLAIVRHVATNHAGTVSVTSTEGEGSTFVLTIPHSSADPQEER